MGRAVLQIYVAICIFMIILSLIATVVDGTAHFVLKSGDDWLIFIIACGALAISEALEESK